MGLKSVVTMGLAAALALGLPAHAQYVVLDNAGRAALEEEAATSDDYQWAIAVDGGVVAMSGDVPYDSVANLLSRRAGISAELGVRPDAPLGFLRDALLAIEAVGYLEQGEVGYRDGAWSLTGTMLPGENVSDLTSLLANPTGPGPAWVLALEEPAETAAIPASIDPSPLPEAENAELTSRVDALLAETPAPDEPTAEPSDLDASRTVSEEIPQDAPEAPEPEPSDIVVEVAPPPDAGAEPAPEEDVSAEVEIARSTPEPEPTDAAAIVMCEAQVADLLESRSVLFASGRSAITEDSQTLLSDLADVFAICPDAPIYVEGHTDADGGDRANLLLSLSRAESVVDALVDLGVRPGRLYAVGYGASLPIASNDTPAGKAQNRRIVFNFEDIAAQGGVER